MRQKAISHRRRWQLAALAAIPTVAAIGVALPGRVGGRVMGRNRADVARLEGAWRSGPEIPTPRSEVAAATAEGTIYVLGGLAEDGRSLNTVEALAPGAEAWSARAPLPEQRDHLAAVELGGRLWAAAGSPGWFTQTTSQTLWVYDAAADRWEGRAPMPLGRAGHAAAVIDGRIYIAGGIGPEPQRLQVYDSRTDSWALRASMPRPLEHLAAAAIGGKLYVIGGRWGDVGNVAMLHEYDPTTDRWRELPPMPTPRGGLAAAALGGKLYVTGGEVLDESRVTFPQLEVFDPATGAWESATPTPTGRHGLAAAVRDGELYILAGGRLAGLDVSGVTEVFSPGG